MDPLYDESTIDAVRTLKADAAFLAERLVMDSGPAIELWKQAVSARLLPRLSAAFPLVAAICGGGSSGKSTLFNTLVGEAVSPTGGLAGINRRILVALGAGHQDHPDTARALFEPFGCAPQPLTAMAQLTTPGDPLLVYASALPANLALLDTPDFDTGSGGGYQNREMAEQSLNAADVLIYIFTNANYNNRDNTDFMARLLTAVGTRSCFLVYRVASGFSDQEVLEHAGTVARHLYGDRAATHVLGIYRAGEENRVAAGQRPMTVVPVRDGQSGFVAALTQIDPRQMRRDLHHSVFSDVVHQGQTILDAARASRSHLWLYLESLRIVQRYCVQEALGHLPMDAVVRRFAEIWQETDPSHVKIMRKTGQVVEAPARLLMRVVRWMGGVKATPDRLSGGEALSATMQADLVGAVNRLRQAVVDPLVSFDLTTADPATDRLREVALHLPAAAGVRVKPISAGRYAFEVPLHPSLATAQAALRGQNWSELVDEMLSRQASLLSFSAQLEAELLQLAREQRARMTAGDQIRQTAAAMLNIIPATAAVTYVLHTGDPIGATGIKVKLAGLLGLNDLVALVAIPATAGMKKADLKQLEALLSPVAGAWLSHKLTAIEALFEEVVTGSVMRAGQSVMTPADERMASMTDSLARCNRALEKRS